MRWVDLEGMPAAAILSLLIWQFNTVLHFYVLNILFHYSDATLQFTESDYSNREDMLFIAPVVQLFTTIATDLTVRIAPLNITETLTRPLPSDFPTIPPFNPDAPNIATSKLRNKFSCAG